MPTIEGMDLFVLSDFLSRSRYSSRLLRCYFAERRYREQNGRRICPLDSQQIERMIWPGSNGGVLLG